MSEIVLETRNLSKSFGTLAACKNVNLDLRHGEIHALIGPNGAGKSTLIKQIAGEIRPDTGQVVLNETDVTKMRIAQRAKLGLARTFQVSALAMESTVLENALLGAIGAVGRPFSSIRAAKSNQALKERALEAIERVNLAAFANTTTSELSHGQRRQLEVAVALTLKPCAFVMDEPMAGLGAQGSHTLTGFLDGLRQEAPILMVEHDMDAVFALADRVSVLVYGEIIATGPVEDIRRDRFVQRAYLGEDA